MANKAILVGNLGKDPEIRVMNNGTKIAKFSLATSERWKDKQSGEKKEKTHWHNVVVFNEGLIGIIERYVKKGSKLYVEGSIETRKWQDQSGADRYATEIVLKAFGGIIELLSDNRGGSDSSGGDDRDSGSYSGGGGGGGRSGGGNRSGSGMGGGSGGGGYAADLDDDIPF